VKVGLSALTGESAVTNASPAHMSAGNQRVVSIGRPSGADCDERSKPDVKPALRYRELGSVRPGRHRACSSWRPAGERGGRRRHAQTGGRQLA